MGGSDDYGHGRGFSGHGGFGGICGGCGRFGDSGVPIMDSVMTETVVEVVRARIVWGSYNIRSPNFGPTKGGDFGGRHCSPCGLRGQCLLNHKSNVPRWF